MSKKNNKSSMELLNLYHQLLSIEQNHETRMKYPVFEDLSANEISIISMVAHDPDIILKDICTAMSLPKSTLTHLINRLEKKEYLNRKISQKDFRSYGLKLTEKGIEAEHQHQNYERYIMDCLDDALEEKEEKQLLDLLQKIITYLDK